MIHLEDKTPEYFSENSRDFQLLCRVLNIFLNSLVERQRKIVGNWSIETLDESLLALMARRLGFMDGSYIPPAILRNICKSYPRILKYKGTQQAVREAAYAVLSAHQEVTSLAVIYQPTLEVKDGESTKQIPDPYIHVKCNVTSGDEVYLEKLYPYILPAGVKYDYTLSSSKNYRVGTKISPLITVGRIRGWGSAISKIVGNKPGSSSEGPEELNSGQGWNTPLSPGMSRIYSKVNVGIVVGNGNEVVDGENKWVDVNAAVKDVDIKESSGNYQPDPTQPTTQLLKSRRRRLK